MKSETNFVRYWNDIQFMYTVLREYGYDKTHIKVLMSDGTDSSTATGLDRRIANSGTMYDSSPTDLFDDGLTEVNVNNPATKTNLINILDSYKTSLTPKDSLFIFTTSHGSWDSLGTEENNNVKLYLWNNEVISDDEFVGKLNDINVGNITMVMEQCYGGGFKDEFMLISPHSSGLYGANQKRILITASAFNEVSWANGFSNVWNNRGCWAYQGWPSTMDI